MGRIILGYTRQGVVPTVKRGDIALPTTARGLEAIVSDGRSARSHRSSRTVGKLFAQRSKRWCSSRTNSRRASPAGSHLMAIVMFRMLVPQALNNLSGPRQPVISGPHRLTCSRILMPAYRGQHSGRAATLWRVPRARDQGRAGRDKSD